MNLPFDPVDEAHRNWVESGWGEVADGMAAVTSVMRAHQIMLARVEDVLRPHGLTFSRYELLMLLSFSSAGSMPMAKASARLQVHPTSVTNTVDRLEEAGLVRRVPNPTDGRGTLVEITDVGRQLGAVASGDLNAKVFSQIGLSPSRTRTLVSVLTHLRRDAGDFG
ncbi:MarR family transcriptional regulator [Mycobacterium sp. CBMA271]|uniref:MarR family winged helix-turn-helix transcriptional regulator n=1 Tax=unclassified Mycobacteroides TaxID=2618759 RepID=UPI0012DEC286|nr:MULTISPECIES: MarR family transcriptional regulator [unclassified Mycobacteroides]MUM15664.1 MarR family transcriptional regulator [Mycobacteroides sp. CBMA 326]MUM17459.1 MarR family transcriptional regulator [Mycobacteroides sp. CBMA 326]MUM21936.1 MarR family transcriptional regulator [Mycobacteroides sp. CBMA 271]